MFYKTMERFLSRSLRRQTPLAEDWHALITGANRGIGFALTQELLTKDMRVSACVRDPNNATQLQALQATYGSRLSIYPLDVTNEQQIKELSWQIEKPIDVLINNAGIMGPIGNHNDGSLKEFEKVFAANTLAPWFMCKYFLPQIEQSQLKIIMNMTSTFGITNPGAVEGYIPYRASKYAATFLMDILEKTHSHIKVASIHPGWVRTDMGGPQGELEPAQSAEKIYEVLMDIASQPKKMGEGVIDVTTYRNNKSAYLRSTFGCV